MTSPSLTTYSLPSTRKTPSARQAAFAFVAHVVGVGDNFGPDKALKVGMDDASGLRGLPALVDGPGADFVRAGRKVAVQAKGGVAGVDDAYKAAFSSMP